MDDASRSGNGFTVKEVVLNIERDVRALSAKFDAYIGVHQGQHIAEQAADASVRAQPKASAAGQALLDDIQAVADAHRDTRTIVDHHDVLIQRLIGATTLASLLGLGGVGFMVVRILVGEQP